MNKQLPTTQLLCFSLKKEKTKQSKADYFWEFGCLISTRTYHISATFMASLVLDMPFSSPVLAHLPTPPFKAWLSFLSFKPFLRFSSVQLPCLPIVKLYNHTWHTRHQLTGRHAYFCPLLFSFSVSQTGFYKSFWVTRWFFFQSVLHRREHLESQMPTPNINL